MVTPSTLLQSGAISSLRIFTAISSSNSSSSSSTFIDALTAGIFPLRATGPPLVNREASLGAWAGSLTGADNGGSGVTLAYSVNTLTRLAENSTMVSSSQDKSLVLWRFIITSRKQVSLYLSLSLSVCVCLKLCSLLSNIVYLVLSFAFSIYCLIHSI